MSDSDEIALFCQHANVVALLDAFIHVVDGS
jgi:hypothetical protein